MILLVASTSWLGAQVAVDIVLDQEQFLRDESLPLKVRINNLSGQVLHLGKEADWLTFQVETDTGRAVGRLGQVPVEGEFDLESAKAGTRRVDIMPYFDLSRAGRYSVVATLRLKQWGQEFVSKPQPFEIITGFKLWEQEFGLPGAKGAPEVRKYVLQQANYLKRLMLYLRLTDEQDVRVYRVLPIGPMVSFSRPEAQVDKESNLHVLNQFGGWSFNYVVITPQGTVLVRHKYDYTGTRPVLRMTEGGKVYVSGGIRRIGPDDLPPPDTESSTNDVKAPKP